MRRWEWSCYIAGMGKDMINEDIFALWYVQSVASPLYRSSAEWINLFWGTAVNGC